MERKRAFQMREKFERCKTPMGSVPISVIMGFDYPIGNFIRASNLDGQNILVNFYSPGDFIEPSVFAYNIFETLQVPC